MFVCSILSVSHTLYKALVLCIVTSYILFKPIRQVAYKVQVREREEALEQKRLDEKLQMEEEEREQEKVRERRRVAEEREAQGLEESGVEVEREGEGGQMEGGEGAQEEKEIEKKAVAHEEEL